MQNRPKGLYSIRYAKNVDSDRNRLRQRQNRCIIRCFALKTLHYRLIDCILFFLSLFKHARQLRRAIASYVRKTLDRSYLTAPPALVSCKGSPSITTYVVDILSPSTPPLVRRTSRAPTLALVSPTCLAGESFLTSPSSEAQHKARVYPPYHMVHERSPRRCSL